MVIEVMGMRGDGSVGKRRIASRPVTAVIVIVVVIRR